MTSRDDETGALLGRALHDITQLLESAHNADERVRRVLERLRDLVPYDQCALLDAQIGRDLRVVSVPESLPDEHILLTAKLVHIFGQLTHAPATNAPPPNAPHLAAPLIGLDEVIGLLFVRTALRDYDEFHVRALSIVAAKLAAYLTMLAAQAELAELARERDEARRVAETASSAKDEFLALVSHELKTPLATILASTRSLRSLADERAREDVIAEIERNAQTQSKLIDGILDLVCVASAELRLQLSVIAPAALIDATLEGLRAAADRKSIQINAELDLSTMPLVVDAARIGQVIATLVANAINFAPVGGHIDVRLERATGFARIQVCDRGQAISPEALPHVFDRFPPADATAARADQGLGVGLAMVKGLVNLHGGLVRVESEPAHGTIFTLELPYVPEIGTLSASPGANRLLAGVRVLLVDHDLSLRESFQAVLEDCGADVTAVATGAEALAALTRCRPDVLLFGDLATPPETVFAFMREAIARASALPAASVSTWRQGEREREIAAGFRVHLRKPIDINTLIDTVADLAGRDRLLRGGT